MDSIKLRHFFKVKKIAIFAYILSTWPNYLLNEKGPIVYAKMTPFRVDSSHNENDWDNGQTL